MRVTALELANFRNYAALRFEPAGGVCIFLGANAQGKSNLLEALSLLSTGKSFRAARESDLVRSGAPLARVAARVATKAGEVQAACIITRVGDGTRKRFARNGRTVPYSQFLGGITAVTFMPFDLQLVTGPPALRRRLLNAALSQSDRQYYRRHAIYLQILLQKNALLKAPSIDRSLLSTVMASQTTLQTKITLVREALPALWHSRAGIVASGTATVEAAMMNTPFVMVYCVSALTYVLGKPRVKVPHFAMVNLIAGEEVVPELVQHDFTAQNVVSRLREILPDGEPRERMLKGLARVKKLLRAPGADDGTAQRPADRAAEIILGLPGVV